LIRRALERLYERVVDSNTGSGWRLPALDGLRGVAALMVVVAHTRHRCTSDDSLVWAPIERGGLGGVVLFFALSGFLLYLPWLRSTTEHRAKPRFKAYALRRCLRIMPAYYVSVIVVAMMHFAAGDPLDPPSVALHFVFLQTLLHPLQSVYWTLQVEEYFYWVLPLLHRWVTRSGITVVIAGSVAISGGWALASLLLPKSARGIWLVETPFFLPAFVLGIATAIAWQRRSTPSRSLIWAGVAAYVALSPLSLYLTRFYDERCNTIMELLMAPAASAVVLGVARSGSRFLEHPIMRFVGAISFSLYLWHLVVIKILPIPQSIAHMFIPRLMLTLAVAIPVALASYLLVERPFLRLRPNATPRAVPS
jgi:peptidoglycan/LPS O-acetylase OafA/YrhL